MDAKKFELMGWFLFLVSGVFFLADALESGDKTALGSAITWMLGVGFFIWSGKIGGEDS